jgi:hypothetical protein
LKAVQRSQFFSAFTRVYSLFQGVTLSRPPSQKNAATVVLIGVSHRIPEKQRQVEARLSVAKVATGKLLYFMQAGIDMKTASQLRKRELQQ